MAPNCNHLITIFSLIFLFSSSAHSACIKRNSSSSFAGKSSSRIDPPKIENQGSSPKIKSPTSRVKIEPPSSSPNLESPNGILEVKLPKDKTRREKNPAGLNQSMIKTQATESGSSDGGGSLTQKINEFGSGLVDGGGGGSNSPDLKELCSKTDYPSLCLAAINPLVSGNPDDFKILETAITVCISHVKEALAKADKMAGSSEKTTATNLVTCNETYNDALDNLQSAIDAIKTRDIGTINSMLSAAITDFTTCDDEFSLTGMPSPMADIDDKLTKLVSNSLAIASVVKI